MIDDDAMMLLLIHSSFINPRKDSLAKIKCMAQVLVILTMSGWVRFRGLENILIPKITFGWLNGENFLVVS
jgi:hypothetical protein